MKNEKGFTLIELLVVIVIIGILSGIGYFSFDKIKYLFRTDTRQLYNVITKARSISVKTNREIHIGITGKQIDYYKDDQLVESTSLQYFDIYSNLSGGELGGKELPNPISCTSGTVPSYVCNACGGNLIGCNEFNEWLDSFNGKDYDYILTLNPIGTSTTEATFQFKHYKTGNLVDVVKTNITGYTKVVY